MMATVNQCYQLLLFKRESLVLIPPGNSLGICVLTCPASHFMQSGIM